MVSGDHGWAWRSAMTEHEAGIEWVTGHRLKSGRGDGSGHGLRFGY